MQIIFEAEKLKKKIKIIIIKPNKKPQNLKKKPTKQTDFSIWFKRRRMIYGLIYFFTLLQVHTLFVSAF
jgi:hypothetical protein